MSKWVYTVLKIQSSKEEAGPYKDVESDETASILSDFEEEKKKESLPTYPNFFWPVMPT